MKKNKFVQSIAILTMVSGGLLTCPAVLANTVHRKDVAVNRVAKVSAMKAKPIITANNFATTPSNNTSIKAVINYQYNGKTISSYTENVQPNASIDINSHLPQGYQTPNGYTPQANFPVQNGVATINVPVVPINTSNSDSGNINVTINYTYNGKTVGTGTETIASGSTIDVSKELPKGYQVSSEYKPSNDIPVQDGKATIEVPVTPTSSSSSNQGEKMVIDYVDANGNQVGTATVNVQSGQPVDVTKTLPSGYQLSPNFKPQANIPVVDGVATIKVQVVKSASSNSSSNDSSSSVANSNSSSSSATNSTDNNSSSATSTASRNNSSASSANDNNSSSSASSDTSAVENSSSDTSSATSDTNSSSINGSESSSVNNGSSSTATTDNNSSSSNTADNGSSNDNGSSSSASADTNNSTSSDSGSSSVASTDNGGSQNSNSSSVVAGNVDNGGNQKQDGNYNDDSSSQSANKQNSSSSNQNSPTVSATEGVKDMKGDTSANKINYTDDKGNVVKSVPTKNGKANSNDIQSNLPLGANLNGATVSKDSNGNLNVSLPQTGEKTRNSIIVSLGTMLISLSGIIALWFKNKKNKNI